MLTKPFKPLALAFLVNLIISVEDKIKYKVKYKPAGPGLVHRAGKESFLYLEGGGGM